MSVAQDTIKNPDSVLNSERNHSLPKDCTILVVEHDVPSYVMISRILIYLGIHCEWKTSGFDVVHYAETLPHIDLILVDLELPFEDVYSILVKIRLSSQFSKLPVIALTSIVNSDELTKLQIAGFDAYLTKPIDENKFPGDIRDILFGKFSWN